MDVKVECEGGRYTVICPAEMGWESRVDLVEATQAAVAEGEDEPMASPFDGVIVDLGAVEHINSAGIGAIFTLRKFAVERGGTLAVWRPRATVARVLNVVNLPALIPVVQDHDAACRALETTAALSGH